MEVSHTNFSEVTIRLSIKLRQTIFKFEFDIPRMVFIHVGSVVMLATSKTTTTWVLAVLSYTTVTGRHMAAAEEENVSLALFQFSSSFNTTNATGDQVVGEWNRKGNMSLISC